LCRDVSLKLLVNQVRTAHEAEEITNNITGVAKRFLHLEVGSYGSLPYDSYLIKAVRRQMPVTLAYPNSPAAFAFGRLAATIWNEEPPELQNKPGLLNFFRRIVKPAGWDEARNG
jgi:flagellar biosynthesis protein FlhG